MTPSSQRIVSSDSARESLINIVSQRTTTALVLTDADGRIIWANLQFQKVTGYPLAEIAGRKPGDVLQGPLSDPSAISQMRHAIANSTECRVQIINYTKMGQPYWVEVELHPARNEVGAVTNFLALQREITKDRMGVLLKEIQIEAQRIVAISDSAADAVRKLIPVVHRNMRWTQTAWLGIDDGSPLAGEPIENSQPNGCHLSPEELRTLVASALQSKQQQVEMAHGSDWTAGSMAVPERSMTLFTLSRRQSAADTAVFLAKDTDMVPDSEQVVQLLNSIGEAISQMERQVTLKLQIERQKEEAILLAERATRLSTKLQRSSADLLALARTTALQTMTGGFLNELNQPLTAALLYISALSAHLAADASGDFPGRDTIENVKQQLSRCATILEKFGTLAGAATATQTSVTIRDLIDDALELLPLDSTESGLTISVVHAEENEIVSVVKVELQLVIISLVQASMVGATGSARREIDIVTTIQDDSRVLVTISNRHTGVPTAQDGGLSLLPITSNSREGEISLAICRMIVERHGGNLRYEARNGGGTHFSFEVPVNHS